MYYALFFVYWQLIPSRQRLPQISSCVVGDRVVAAVYGLVARVVGWQWVNGMSGVVTAQGVPCRAGTDGGPRSPGTCMERSLPSPTHGWPGEPEPAGPDGVGLGRLGRVVLSTLIRGDVVGLVFGFAVVVYAGLARRYAKAWIVRRFWKGLPLALLLVRSWPLVLTVAIGGTYLGSRRRARDVHRGAGGSLTVGAPAPGSFGSRRCARGWPRSLRHPVGLGYGNAVGT